MTQQQSKRHGNGSKGAHVIPPAQVTAPATPSTPDAAPATPAIGGKAKQAETVTFLSSVRGWLAHGDKAVGLSPNDQRFVLETSEAIATKLAEITVNIYAIGEMLNAMRDRIGKEAFGEYMVNTFPKLGRSFKTGYRYRALAEGLAVAIPNATVRAAVIRHTGDGSGILALDEKTKMPTGKLTAYAQKALKAAGPIPAGKLDTEGAERYGIQFAKTLRKLKASGGGSSKAERQATKAAKLVKDFTSFKASYGMGAAEKVLARINRTMAVWRAEQEAAAQAPAKAPAAKATA